MSLNKIETAEGIFEVNNDDYDYICGLLERLTAVYAPKNKPTPSPTVEINTFAAKFALEHLKSIFKTGTPILVEFEQAISKAESKEDDSFGNCLKRDAEDFQRIIRESSPVTNQMSGNGGLSNKTLADSLNGPALPIQDQIDELRKEIADLQHSMRNVIADMNNKLIPAINNNFEDTKELKHTISQLKSVIEGMRPNLNTVKV